MKSLGWLFAAALLVCANCTIRKYDVILDTHPSNPHLVLVGGEQFEQGVAPAFQSLYECDSQKSRCTKIQGDLKKKWISSARYTKDGDILITTPEDYHVPIPVPPAFIFIRKRNQVFQVTSGNDRAQELNPQANSNTTHSS